MTYDQRTRDLAHVIDRLCQAETDLLWASHPMKRLGLFEEEKALQEMWNRICTMREEMVDALDQYAEEGLEEKGDDD